MTAYARLLVLSVVFPAVVHASSLRVTATLGALTEIRAQIEAYRARTGTYPESLDQLEGARAVDPWGERYVYRKNEAGMVLYSAGKNATDEHGEGDDVVSWELLRREFYPELGHSPAVRWDALVAMAVAISGCVWLYARHAQPNSPLRTTRRTTPRG